MSYMFDSSAIFKALAEGAVEFLSRGYTLELARYELGNILWKELALRGRISDEEAKSLIRLIKGAMNVLEVLSANCREEDVVSVAKALKITFYDASYVFYAKEMGLPLVTEDESLISKAKAYLKVLKLEDLMRA